MIQEKPKTAWIDTLGIRKANPVSYAYLPRHKAPIPIALNATIKHK